MGIVMAEKEHKGSLYSINKQLAVRKELERYDVLKTHSNGLLEVFGSFATFEEAKEYFDSIGKK